jgi:hypothetical protein
MESNKRNTIPTHLLDHAIACQLRIRIGLRLVCLIRAHLALRVHRRNAGIVWRRVVLALVRLKTLQARPRSQQSPIHRKAHVSEQAHHAPTPPGVPKLLANRTKAVEQGRAVQILGCGWVLTAKRIPGFTIWVWSARITYGLKTKVLCPSCLMVANGRIHPLIVG